MGTTTVKHTTQHSTVNALKLSQLFYFLSPEEEKSFFLDKRAGRPCRFPGWETIDGSTDLPILPLFIFFFPLAEKIDGSTDRRIDGSTDLPMWIFF
jgi:hypothetical protein